MNDLVFAAIVAALQAGERIMEVYRTDFDVQSKSDESPLTLADQRAHQSIIHCLSHTGLPVLSEEGRDIPFSERRDWNCFWMVDPLDGTKEFIKRNGEFTVNIALIEQGIPVAGVIFVPVTRMLYFGWAGKAFKIQCDNSQPAGFDSLISAATPIPVTVPRKFTVVASRSHLSEETTMFIDGLRTQHPDLEFISAGSSLKLCLVAEGLADVYPRFAPTMEWDTAAGQAICSAAGKHVLDYHSNAPMQYNKENLLNSWFIAS